MFISNSSYEGILGRLELLETQNKHRMNETHKNAERIHELKYSSEHSHMLLDVQDENGDPIIGVGRGAQHIQKWVDMRDVLRAIADKIGFKLVYKRGVEGHPVVIDESDV